MKGVEESCVRSGHILSVLVMPVCPHYPPPRGRLKDHSLEKVNRLWTGHSCCVEGTGPRRARTWGSECRNLPST